MGLTFPDPEAVILHTSPLDIVSRPDETGGIMKHSVDHGLGIEKAKTVAEAAWASYSEKYSEYSPSCTWDTEHKATIAFAVMGKTLKGVLEVSASAIDLELDVPFMMRPFKKVALGVIEKEIRKWIAKSEAGTL